MTIHNVRIYPDKFLVTYLNGKDEPFSATDDTSYEVIENGESLGILKKKSFKELTKEERYDLYNKETTKRAAYPRKPQGMTETKKYMEWETKKIEKM